MGRTDPGPAEVTRLLEAWSGGRREALEQLILLIYAQLRRMARAQLAKAGRAHTLQPTELVHELWVRMVDQRTPFQNRLHFFAIAAKCMRRILADHARRRRALKRPQIDGAVELEHLEQGASNTIEQLLAINETLDRLEQTDPRRAQILELTMFAGLQLQEIATLLGVSLSTVKRELKEARAAVHAALGVAS